MPSLLLYLRLPVVTIWISPCHDPSTCPLIDSIEVYAKEREELAFISTGYNPAARKTIGNAASFLPVDKEDGTGMLLSSIQSLTSLGRFLGHDTMESLSADRRGILKNIIERTALDESKEGSLRDRTIVLLNEIESDTAARQYFIDEATLRGSIVSLDRVHSFIEAALLTDSEPSKKVGLVHHCVELLCMCLHSAISIARVRGENYKKAVLDIIADGLATVSPATKSKQILDLCRAGNTEDLDFFQSTHLVTELVLLEIAGSDSVAFANFGTLTDLLRSSDSEVVRACCNAVSDIVVGECTEVTPEKPDTASQDHFITYQCDSCKAFPITVSNLSRNALFCFIFIFVVTNEAFHVEIHS